MERGRAHAAGAGEVFDAKRLVVVLGDPTDRATDMGEAAVGQSDLAHALTQGAVDQPPEDLALDQRREDVAVARAVEQAHHANDGVEELGRGVGDAEPAGAARGAARRGGAGRRASRTSDAMADGRRMRPNPRAGSSAARVGVMPGDRQVDRGDQVLARSVVVHAIADGQALGTLGDEGHDRPGGRRLGLARSAGGREQDAVDRRRLVGPRVSGDQRPQLCEQGVGAQRTACPAQHRSHERNIHVACDARAARGRPEPGDRAGLCIDAAVLFSRSTPAG